MKYKFKEITYAKKDIADFPINVRVDRKQMLKHNWLDEILSIEMNRNTSKTPYSKQASEEKEDFLPDFKLIKYDNAIEEEEFVKQLNVSLANKKGLNSISMKNSGLNVKVSNSSAMCLIS